MSEHRRYEVLTLTYEAPEPAGSHVTVDLSATFEREGEVTRVKGFYAGDGTYMIRFLPLKEGIYTYKVAGIVTDEGQIEVLPAAEGQHGPVRACGSHLRYDDGTWFHSFGTTVYALAHQDPALTEETFASLAGAPFNKIRMCVFPKHYDYNKNDPEFFPFHVLPGQTYVYQDLPAFGGITEETPCIWDVHHPDFAFWDSFEEKLQRLGKMGIQVDLILFHPYDRWGFSILSYEDDLVYLDYLTRRFSAYPHLWWSMANEYDLMGAKTADHWVEIEQALLAGDPYRHMLSNHNCFPLYDFSHEAVTHASCQLRTMNLVPELIGKYGKPVLYDECVYEGNLPQTWGSISGREMVNRFWKVTATGGYCTHGEVFLDPEETDLDNAVLWWAKGGKLKGESPKRIAFLRGLMEEIGDPLVPHFAGLTRLMMMPREALLKIREQAGHFKRFIDVVLATPEDELRRHVDAEFEYFGRTEDESTFLFYYGTDCHALVTLDLPEGKSFDIEIIDAWNMTRQKVLSGASGHTAVRLPGREYIAVLARAV